MRDDANWIGRTEERRDTIGEWPAQALHAALDRPGEPPQKGDPLPPLWRWMYFLEARRRAELGREGHPERGAGLTPPIKLPRRMWAGGRLTFQRPLKVGANATRVSKVADIKRKQGRSGPLAFVTISHEVLTADGLVETEEQDIVYRPDPSPSAEPRSQEHLQARTDERWSRIWAADPVLLFRYSALTFNGHRIHYDVDYCREIEGYAGLVVHGPLLATLMLELAREQGPDRRIATFEFRAVSPVVHTEPFEVCGRPFDEMPDGSEAKTTPAGADVWVRAAGPSGRWGGRLAMSGRLTYA